MANVSEILDSINGNVLTGGRRTKASGVRETLALIAESYLNKEDDADVAGGYLKISDTEAVDVSFIKKTVPTGQFLKDDGTWADAESLSTNTIFLGNDDLTYNSGWADGDTLLAQKNTIYYLQNGSPGETLTITIDDVDVEAGSMVAFTDGQAAGDGIQGTARILDAIPSAGGDINVYSGETLIYRFDGTVWRLMMRYSRNLISQSITSGSTRFAPSADAVFTALAGKVNTTLTLTINGVSQNLAANRSWTVDALPTQTGNSGKFLTTNGTVASWASLSSTNITDALTYTPVNKAGDTLSGFLTLHADPTNSMHAVTKNYVDNYITGLVWKQRARIVTTTNITLSGLQTLKGVSLIAGDVVLVAGNTDAKENGLWNVSASSWTRTLDANTGAELFTAAVMVGGEDNANPNTQWANGNSTAITIGSTNIVFNQIAGAGVYTNGTGISLSGNAFSLDLTRVASGSVTGLLSSTDWSTFNGKFNTPTGLTNTRVVYFDTATNTFVSSRLQRNADDSISWIPLSGSNTFTINNGGLRITGGNIDIVSGSFDGLLVTGRIINRNSDNYSYQLSNTGSNFYFGLGGTNTGVLRTVTNIIMSLNDNGVAIGTGSVNSACSLDLQSTSKGLGLNRITSLPSYLTRKANFGFDDTLNVPVITLDRASNATSSWFEIATKNTASKAATAADGGAITNWSGNTDYFYTTTVAGAKLGQNVLVNFDATLGALINGTNVAVNAYVSATNTVIVWVRTGTYVPPTTLSGNLLISVI